MFLIENVSTKPQLRPAAMPANHRQSEEPSSLSALLGDLEYAAATALLPHSCARHRNPAAARGAANDSLRCHNGKSRLCPDRPKRAVYARHGPQLIDVAKQRGVDFLSDRIVERHGGRLVAIAG
ncbi:hypothetical protein [Rhizobium chutanense]|uniref:hypothetical protein n=1 Tax=Rhizobium chutanense TaxID=2035448 RepID=UPI0013DE8063|nr:hypothetical protein [Rhizobium chutanense]